MLKQFLKVALLLPLAACSMASDRSLITNSTSLTGSTKAIGPSLASEIDPNYAVAYFPSIAGPISSVRQKSGNNRVHQTVLYPNVGYGGGENQIIVDVAQSGGNKEYYRAPTRRKILSEMKRFFPTMAMTIDEVPGENFHGVYGYAHGTSKTDGNCIYAWQVVTKVTRNDLNDFQRFLQPKYSAKIRVRYCHPTKTKQQLLVVMNGLRVKEVIGSTMEMLRFAEGAGYVNQRQVSVQPIVRAEPVRVKKVSTPKRRIVKKKVQAAVTVPDGPRVMLPSEVGDVPSVTTTPLRPRKIIVTELDPADFDAPKIPLPN
tara:strand:+ start:2272 stop:3216 length:945 start_codon:yes stop_codon:yes gene_type:complete